MLNSYSIENNKDSSDGGISCLLREVLIANCSLTATDRESVISMFKHLLAIYICRNESKSWTNPE